MLKLGMVSREAFLALEDQLSLSFDGDHQGLLEVTSDPDEAKGLRTKAHALTQLGIPHEWLEPDAVNRQEPGLQYPKPLQSLIVDQWRWNRRLPPLHPGTDGPIASPPGCAFSSTPRSSAGSAVGTG